MKWYGMKGYEVVWSERWLLFERWMEVSDLSIFIISGISGNVKIVFFLSFLHFFFSIFPIIWKEHFVLPQFPLYLFLLQPSILYHVKYSPNASFTIMWHI